ncbi:MAG: YhcH/YjgK/YiaL family protein [Chitinophagaceae bacterium]
MKAEIKNVVMVSMVLAFGLLGISAKHHPSIHSVSMPESNSVFKPGDTTWTKAKAAKWFKSREWMHGLKLKPHASIDQLEFAKQYAANKSRWDKAFAYLKTTDYKSLGSGHYQIEGEDVYANVTEAPSKPFEQTQFEAHQNYSDIHLMISGKEKIGVASLAGATVKTAYDASKDIAFYNTEGKVYTADPGTFFIFCPGNAHRPGIKVDGEDVVRKIVIKIKSAGK